MLLLLMLRLLLLLLSVYDVVVKITQWKKRAPKRSPVEARTGSESCTDHI
jgi:hypothetical protein